MGAGEGGAHREPAALLRGVVAAPPQPRLREWSGPRSAAPSAAGPASSQRLSIHSLRKGCGSNSRAFRSGLDLLSRPSLSAGCCSPNALRTAGQVLHLYTLHLFSRSTLVYQAPPHVEVTPSGQFLPDASLAQGAKLKLHFVFLTSLAPKTWLETQHVAGGPLLGNE